jgi:hypothetical protein
MSTVKKYRIILQRHGESCANVMKRQYGMYYHTFYDDPELTAGTIKDIAYRRDGFFNDLCREKPFFVAASALLRAQETAHYATWQLDSGSRPQPTDSNIYILPYITELGGTNDNMPMPEDRRKGLFNKVEDKVLRSRLDYRFNPGEYVSPDPAKFMDWLLRNWGMFDLIQRQENRPSVHTDSASVRAPGGTDPTARPNPAAWHNKGEDALPTVRIEPHIEIGGYFQGGGDRTEAACDDNTINMYIVSHKNFIMKFKSMFFPSAQLVGSADLNNLDKFIIDITFNGDFDRDTGELIGAVSRPVVEGRHVYTTARTGYAACENDYYGGRCRKKVCKTISIPGAIPTEEDTSAPVSRRREREELDACVSVNDLLDRAATAKYSTNILAVARKLKSVTNPVFQEKGTKLEKLYKPGWFSTRSTRKLGEDLEGICRIAGTTTRAIGGAHRTRRCLQRKRGCRRTRGQQRHRKHTRRH